MKYIVFNKEINISKDYINKWISIKNRPLTTERLEALAYTSGCDADDSADEILNGIIQGIEDYYVTYKALGLL